MSTQTISLQIVNQNQLLTDPLITFVQSLDAIAVPDGPDTPVGPKSTTKLHGNPLDATATINKKSTALANGTAYKLSTIENGTIVMNPNWAGNIFFSDTPLNLGSSGQGKNFANTPKYPTNPNGAVTTDAGRYNYIELAGGSNTNINPDITYINYFAVPIQMSAPAGTRGTPSSQTQVNKLITQLATLSNNNSAVIAKNGTTITRVISPDNGAAAYDVYPSFSTYINTYFSNPTPAIQLNNTYDGVQKPPNARFKPQSYKSKSVTYANSNTLTIQGTSTNQDIGNFSMTASVTPEQFSSAIYAAVLSYQVTYGPTSQTISGNTGDNDVFATISRDLLAGFNFGFIGSQTQGKKSSKDWQSLAISDAFVNAQPKNQFYNTWAATISNVFPDVYTFPFNDFLTKFSPELTVNTGQTLTITLLNEA